MVKLTKNRKLFYVICCVLTNKVVIYIQVKYVFCLERREYGSDEDYWGSCYYCRVFFFLCKMRNCMGREFVEVIEAALL